MGEELTEAIKLFTKSCNGINENMQLVNQGLKALREDFEKKRGYDHYTPMQHVPFPKPLETQGNIDENFELFKRNWHEYVTAAGIDKWPVTEEKKKINLLLTLVGDEAKIKYTHFSLTEEEKDTTENVLNLIGSRLVSKRNVLYDRYLFHTCSQNENESFDTYLIRLRKIIDMCKYNQGVTADLLLRDRIAFGIRDTNLKKRFLSQDPDTLTLDKIIQEVKVSEVTEDRFKSIIGEKFTKVNKVMNTNKHKDNNKPKKCKFCATYHVFEKNLCPAFGKKCKSCNGNNHFEIVCKKKNNNKMGKKNDIKAVKEITISNNNNSDSESSFTISTVIESNKGNSRADLTLKFNGEWQKVTCDLDSGAQACLIGLNQLRKLTNNNFTMNDSKVTLADYGGHPIEVLGQVKVPCLHNNRKYSIIFHVVDNAHYALLSENACTILGLIRYDKCVLRNEHAVNKITNDDSVNLSDKDPKHKSLINQANQIIQTYSDVFEGYGKLPGEVEIEVDETVKPVIQSPRRIPMALRAHLKAELDGLIKEGIIAPEKANTKWVSNILLVKKANSFRICLDPIPLNVAIKRPHRQSTTIDEILPELGKAKVFSTVDTTKGFWQLKLSEASSKLTTFWTPFGRMRWLRCPFGISSAPELFQMKMYEIIHDIKGIEILADDILIYGIGDTMAEAIMDHNVKLEKLLIRLRENNCKLNKKKLNLCCSEVKFFGHVLSNKGLKADETKISAIKNMPSPKDKSDLLRFLGMLNYLGRYIKNLSAESSILRKLTIEKAEWKWTQEEEHEFQKLKMLVADTKSLKYFEVGKQLTVECDSSSTGLGVVVLQDEQVIAYASRTLTAAEKNYAMIEKELLAIVFACVRFDQLIVGNVTTLIKTDHKPLITIFKKPLLKAPKRLQLMLMVLQRYNIELKFIEGKKNVIADTLSRASLEVPEDFNFINQSNVFKIKVENKVFKRFRKINLVESLKISDERTDNIKSETMKDQSLQKLIPFICNGWPNRIHEVPDDIRLYYKYKHELSTQDGLIFRNCKILIPYSLRKIMVEKVHVAHNGIETSIKLAKDNIFWPNMSTEIKEKVQMCDICVKYSSSQSNPPMQSHEVPTYPFQYVSMDVLATKLKGKAYNMLVTVDHYSDFFELDVLRDLTPGAVIEQCKRNFSRHGIPQRVCTDNGTNFVNRQFKDFERTWEFEHVSSSPHHPRGNGKAEAAVKIAKSLIKKGEESNQDIWYCLLSWRNSPNKINSSSPVQRLFSRKTRSGVPSCNEQYLPKIIDNVPEKIKAQHGKSKFYYDRKTKIIPELEIGQSVAVQVHPQIDKEWSLGVIEQQLKDRSYLVNVDGSTFRRNIVNIKPFVKEEPTDKDDQNIRVPTLDTRSSSNSFNIPEAPEIIAQQGIPSSTQHLTGRPKRNIKLPSHLSDYQLY